MKKEPIKDIYPLIDEAIEEWKKANSPAVIKQRVKELLDQQSLQITMKLLGFDADRWTNKETWKLDHCNGRSGNSTAGDYLKECQGEAVKDWLASVKMPVLSAKLKAELQKSMQAEFETNVRRQALNSTHKTMDAALQVALTNLIDHDFHEKAMKTAQLLEQPNGV